MTQQAPLSCPRDHAALVSSVYEATIEVDNCPTCRGVWLDKGKLEAIQETVERDYAKALADPSEAPLPSLQPRGLIQCPKCAVEMTARQYGMGSQILIDVCPEGCGTWLDQGELAALEILFEKAQAEANDMIPLHWRLWASVVSVLRR